MQVVKTSGTPLRGHSTINIHIMGGICRTHEGTAGSQHLTSISTHVHVLPIKRETVKGGMWNGMEYGMGHGMEYGMEYEMEKP